MVGFLESHTEYDSDRKGIQDSSRCNWGKPLMPFRDTGSGDLSRGMLRFHAADDQLSIAVSD